jgi:nitrite reductase/ring-hydroxylating ferredoxin subunit
MGRILVGKTSDIPSGKMIMVSTDGKDILVTNVDGNYYAMDDTCTHTGASLSEGSLDGSTVTCPWHGSTWDCKTGKMIAFGVQLKDLSSYKVMVESDNVFVED